MLVQVRVWAKLAVASTLTPILKCPVEEEKNLNFTPTDRVVSGVGFVGKLSGIIYFEFPQPLATEITRGMLSMPATETPDAQAVSDVLGEIANMVVGQVKTRLCEGGMVCSLSLPTVYPGLLRDYHTYDETQIGIMGLRAKSSVIRTQVLLRQF